MRALALIFLFWYPGEAGTTAQAQPLLDQFAERLGAHTPGTTWKANYFPTEAAGRAFITSRRPAFGIVSYAMEAKYGKRLALTPIAATRPLPAGKTTESLALYAGPCPTSATAPSGAAVYSSQPWPTDLLRRILPQYTGTPLTPTAGMRRTLEQMTQAGRCEQAILSAAEQASLHVLKTPWANRLTLVARSQPIPTPRVVAFGAQPRTAALREALLRLGSDPAAREILAEMRFAGFDPL